MTRWYRKGRKAGRHVFMSTQSPVRKPRTKNPAQDTGGQALFLSLESSRGQSTADFSEYREEGNYLTGVAVL